MTDLHDDSKAVCRPEHAVQALLEEILGFERTRTSNDWKQSLPRVSIEEAFRRQPDVIKLAIRKHWLFDHLPRYASMVDLSMSEFEQGLAEQFWAGLERQVTEYIKPRKRRRQEISA